MRKTIFVLMMMAILGTGVWAQETEIPSAVGTDYVRVAMHYFDGEDNFVNSDVFFRLSSVDYETGLNYVQFALDGSDFMLYRSPFQILDEGNHDISYRGFDNSDNLELARTFEVVVDNTAPKTILETDKPIYKKGLIQYCSAETSWFVSAKDNISGAGVATGYIGTDYESLEAYGVGEAEDGSTYFYVEEEGPSYIYYTAIDNVGNLAPIQMFKVVVDTTAPVVSIESNNRLIKIDDVYTEFPSEQLVDEEGRIVVSTNEAVSFSAEDELSGVDAIYVKVNDGEPTKYVEPIRFSANDVYDIEVTAIDNVGNISEPVKYTFFVDKIDPDSILDLIDRDENVILAADEIPGNGDNAVVEEAETEEEVVEETELEE